MTPLKIGDDCTLRGHPEIQKSNREGTISAAFTSTSEDGCGEGFREVEKAIRS